MPGHQGSPQSGRFQALEEVISSKEDTLNQVNEQVAHLQLVLRATKSKEADEVVALREKLVRLKESLEKSKTLQKEIVEVHSQVSAHETRAKKAEVLNLRKRKNLVPPESIPEGGYHEVAMTPEVMNFAIDIVVIELTKTYGPLLDATKKDKEKCKSLERKLRAARKTLWDATTSHNPARMPPRFVNPIGLSLPVELRSQEEAALWKDTINQGYIMEWKVLSSFPKKGSSGQTFGRTTLVKRRRGEEEKGP